MENLIKTTAKVTTPTGVKYIPNAVNYNGFLCIEIEVGKGEIVRYEAWSNGFDDAGEEPVYENYQKEYRVYFNAKMVQQSNWTENSIKEFIANYGNMAVFPNTGLSSLCLKWGENPFEYYVEDNEEIKRKEKEQKKLEILDKIKKEYGFIFEVEKTTYFEDEDGKEPCYHYTLKHNSGVEFKFSDRNLFDCGRCINPDYEIAKDWGKGGLLYSKVDSNELWWHSCSKKDGEFIGWQPVRKVDDIELVAYNIVKNYGNAMRGIRM